MYVMCLHNVYGIPEDRISVEISSGVKPEVELLLSVAFSLAVNICVKNVRITTKISQELEVNLIMVFPFGG